MTRRRFTVAAMAALALTIMAFDSRPMAAGAAGAPAFDKFKALAGEWVDLDGAFGPKGQVAVTYRLTGGGTALVETIFVGAPHEMTTVYHLDGSDVVLTHYCAGGNQPKMRAKGASGNVVSFEFDGGTNINPAKDQHMHSARYEFVGPDELKAEWHSWAGGKANPEHVGRFHLGRKK